MKNILSYEDYTEFTGNEIRKWIQYQIDNHTQHEKKAKKLNKFNIIDDQHYMICALRNRNILFVCKSKEKADHIKYVKF